MAKRPGDEHAEEASDMGQNTDQNLSRDAGHEEAQISFEEIADRASANAQRATRRIAKIRRKTASKSRNIRY